MKKKRAIGKTKKPLNTEIVEHELNEKQKLFCQLMLFSRDHFSNASKSYMDAYDLKESQKKVARQAGYRLLTNVYIKQYISKLLKENFKPEKMDNELVKIAMQDKNMIAKLGALQEYNKLMKRIVDKPDINIVIPAPIYGGRAKQKV